MGGGFLDVSLGLFFGARRWLGRFGGAAAVGLFCSSGAALLFAWRDYMPTFTDASLIAAGTGALLWAVLAAEATARRRTWAGLGGFVALEAAVFVRYTDIVVLGCAVVAAMLGLGVWSYNDMRASWLGEIARIVHGRHGPFRAEPGARGGPPRAPAGHRPGK